MDKKWNRFVRMDIFPHNEFRKRTHAICNNIDINFNHENTHFDCVLAYFYFVVGRLISIKRSFECFDFNKVK